MKTNLIIGFLSVVIFISCEKGDDNNVVNDNEKQETKLVISGIRNLEIIDDTTYIVDNTGLKIADFSDINNPLTLAELELSITGDSYLKVDNNSHIFIVYNQTIHIISSIDKDNVVEIKSTDVAGIIEDVDLLGNNLLVSTRDKGIYVFEHSNYTDIELKSNYKPVDNNGDGQDGNHVYVDQDLIYYTNGGGDLHKLSLDNDSQLSINSSYSHDGSSGSFSQGIYINDNLAYLSLGGGGLDIISTTTMEKVASIENADISESMVNEQIIAVEDYGNGIKIYNKSDLEQLSHLFENEGMSILTVDDNNLYLNKNGICLIYNTANLNEPIEIYSSEN